MRKVLTATAATQGMRKNDFSHTEEGELVTYGLERDCEQVDGVCGCKRSLVGRSTHKATTTFKVESRELSDSELTERIRASLAESGWIGNGGPWTPEKDEEFVKAQFRDTVDLWSMFNDVPHGAVLERHGDSFRVRSGVR